MLRLIIQKIKKWIVLSIDGMNFWTLTFKYACLLLSNRLASGIKRFSLDHHVLPTLNAVVCYSTASGPCSELTQWSVVFPETTPKPGWLDIPSLYIEKAANNINMCHQAAWSVVNSESPIPPVKSENYFSQYSFGLEFVHEGNLNKIGRWKTNNIKR